MTTATRGVSDGHARRAARPRGPGRGRRGRRLRGRLRPVAVPVRETDPPRRARQPGRAGRARPSLPQTTRVTTASDPSRRPPDGEGAAHATEVPPEPAPPPAEPRQRWRLTFARDLPPADEVPTGREYVGRWEEALLSSGLPVAVLASGRPRIALGAPLPNGCSAEGELLEFWLTAIRPAWAVREGVTAALPAGHRAVGLENVWLGAPALSGQIAAADYEVNVAVDGAGPGRRGRGGRSAARARAAATRAPEGRDGPDLRSPAADRCVGCRGRAACDRAADADPDSPGARHRSAGRGGRGARGGPRRADRRSVRSAGGGCSWQRSWSR